MQLIPSMDLLSGQVVRLLRGERGQATFYAWRPEAWVEKLVEAGANRIHLVDLDAAFGEPRQRQLLSFPGRWPEVRFQIGGGLRTEAAVQEVIDAGAEAVLGTLALEAPERLAGFPADRLIAALDLRGETLVCRGWTEASPLGLEAAADRLLGLGVDRALVTDISRDGTLEGPGLAALQQVAALGFRVQASGGVRHLADLEPLAGMPGVIGAISGKALLEGTIDLAVPAVRQALENRLTEGGR